MAGGENTLSSLSVQVLAIATLLGVMTLQWFVLRLDHMVETSRHSRELLLMLYKELAILGLTALFLFLFQISGLVVTTELKHQFEQVHIGLFLVAILYTVVCSWLVRYSTAISTQWYRTEQRTARFHHWQMLKRTHRELESELMLRRSQEEERDKLGTLGVCCLRTRKLGTLLKYVRVMEVVRFSESRYKFIQRNALPRDFSFAAYLKRCKQHVFVTLVEIPVGMWAGFGWLMSADLWLRAVVPSYNDSYSLTDLNVVLTSVVLVVGVAIYVKMRSVHWAVMHSSLARVNAGMVRINKAQSFSHVYHHDLSVPTDGDGGPGAPSQHAVTAAAASAATATAAALGDVETRGRAFSLPRSFSQASGDQAKKRSADAFNDASSVQSAPANDEAEMEQAHRAQQALFWFGRPHILLRAMQCTMFLSAVTVALTVNELVDSRWTGDVEVPWVQVLSSLVAIGAVGQLLRYVVPMYTLVVHVGAMVDVDLLDETLLKYHRQVKEMSELRERVVASQLKVAEASEVMDDRTASATAPADTRLRATSSIDQRLRLAEHKRSVKLLRQHSRRTRAHITDFDEKQLGATRWLQAALTDAGVQVELAPDAEREFVAEDPVVDGTDVEVVSVLRDSPRKPSYGALGATASPAAGKGPALAVGSTAASDGAGADGSAGGSAAGGATEGGARGRQTFDGSHEAEPAGLPAADDDKSEAMRHEGAAAEGTATDGAAAKPADVTVTVAPDAAAGDGAGTTARARRRSLASQLRRLSSAMVPTNVLVHGGSESASSFAGDGMSVLPQLSRRQRACRSCRRFVRATKGAEHLWRAHVYSSMRTPLFESVVSTLLLVAFCLSSLASLTSIHGDTRRHILWSELIIMVFFSVEQLVKLWALRSRFFKDRPAKWWRLLDAVVIAVCLVVVVANLVELDAPGFPVAVCGVITLRMIRSVTFLNFVKQEPVCPQVPSHNGGTPGGAAHRPAGVAEDAAVAANFLIRVQSSMHPNHAHARRIERIARRGLDPNEVRAQHMHHRRHHHKHHHDLDGHHRNHHDHADSSSPPQLAVETDGRRSQSGSEYGEDHDTVHAFDSKLDVASRRDISVPPALGRTHGQASSSGPDASVARAGGVLAAQLEATPAGRAAATGGAEGEGGL